MLAHVCGRRVIFEMPVWVCLVSLVLFQCLCVLLPSLCLALSVLQPHHTTASEIFSQRYALRHRHVDRPTSSRVLLTPVRARCRAASPADAPAAPPPPLEKPPSTLIPLPPPPTGEIVPPPPPPPVWHTYTRAGRTVGSCVSPHNKQGMWAGSVR